MHFCTAGKEIRLNFTKVALGLRIIVCAGENQRFFLETADSVFHTFSIHLSSIFNLSFIPPLQASAAPPVCGGSRGQRTMGQQLILALLLSSQICHSFPSFYCFSTHHQPHLPTCVTQAQNWGAKKLLQSYNRRAAHVSFCKSDDTEGNYRLLSPWSTG